MEKISKKKIAALVVAAIMFIAMFVLSSVTLQAGVNCEGIIENKEFKCLDSSDKICVSLLSGGVYWTCYGRLTFPVTPGDPTL